MGAEFPSDFRLILASQSPRRHSLLRDVGVPFTVVSSEADELLTGESASSLAMRNARAKVEGAQLPAGLAAGTYVLGTDTLVTSDRAVMGKPASLEAARRMLLSLSGRTHEVVSGVALGRTGQSLRSASGERRHSHFSRVWAGCATTQVSFLPLSRTEIDAYLATGEWKGKAGGYAIQGIAGLFVAEVRGEYSNVVGLPLCLLAALFREAGFDLLQKRWL